MGAAQASLRGTLINILTIGRRRCDISSTLFHQSRVPIAAKKFPLFSQMILLLMAFTRSALPVEMRYFCLSRDLTSGVTHIGSRDDIVTVLIGVHFPR